jgi:hypothetical protein
VSLAIRRQRINDIAVLGEHALGQSGGPYGQRRLQIGHYAQAGQHLIGSYRRCHVPYDKVEYRTRVATNSGGRRTEPGG